MQSRHRGQTQPARSERGDALARSEVRDGMRIDWNVPIAMDDGIGPALRRLPPDQRRPLPRAAELWPLRQGPRLPGRLSERLAAHGREAPRRHRGLDQQVPELGGGGPREVGAARAMPACAWICAAAAARRASSTISRRARPRTSTTASSGPASQPWSNGKVGLSRRLLLRHQPMARRLAAAAASRRHVRVGGRSRLVSRHDAPRRHRLHVLGELVRHAGEDRAARRRRARQAQPGARRAGVRAAGCSRMRSWP